MSASNEVDPSWDLDQTLIWISSRNAEQIVKASMFRPSDERLTWAWFSSDPNYEKQVSPDEAERLLRQELGAGRLFARDDMEPIVKEWFRETTVVLHLEQAVFKRIWPKPIFTREHLDGTALRRVGYEELRPLFDPVEVMAAFPVPKPIDQVDATAAAETKCRRWLEQLMRASPDISPKPKAHFHIEARAEFDVSERAFERAWASAIAQTGAKWDKAGRRRKIGARNPRT